MIKSKVVLVLIVLSSIKANVSAQAWEKHGPLLVSEVNPHYLVHKDGTPFFWLADTGWEMLNRLSREEINFYLDDRNAKGFNVIQTVIVNELMDKPTNYYGDSIFINNDPEKPAIKKGNNPNKEQEYDFWDHVDFAVKSAQDKGIYIALLPTWGEWVIPRSGTAIFNSMEQTYNYGWFVGNRYRQSPNIIWVLGGDRHPNEREEGVELWRAMAEGIADGVNGVKNFDGKADYSTTLMTHHSFGSSSTWFHNDPWIDFHTWGSYHAVFNNPRSYEAALADWNLPNPKPTLNSEPCYEGIRLNYAIDDNGVFTSTDIRLAAYWSVFSGAAGFTYGANPVWQFADSLRKSHYHEIFMSWQNALNMPGAFQMRHLKKLMESRPMLELKPDQTIIVRGQGNCSERACAIRGNSFLMVYIPTGNSVTIKLGTISGAKVKATWFDPRTGETIPIEEFENTGEKSFDVPGMSQELNWLRTGRGCDWILIIDDATLSSQCECNQ
jgi:hypothetical protein